MHASGVTRRCAVAFGYWLSLNFSQSIVVKVFESC
jgi:hypothetical protein